MTDTIINDEGEIVITTKISAQEYIRNKLMTIDMLQQQINSSQEQLNKEIAELRVLQGDE
jgi:hypothetical protein